MGNNCSLNSPLNGKIHAHTNAHWRRKLDKKEALELYVEDGTLPANCSDELLELRAFVDDPVLFRGLAQFAVQTNMLQVLMCWIEVLEYKHINESSIEYQMGKGLDIYHKYVQSAASPNLRANLDVSIADATITGTALSSHLYDELLHMCLQHIYTSLYVPYKKTAEFLSNSKQARSCYNKVSVDDFEFYEELGQGGFGLVVHCKKKSTGKHYALKMQRKDGLLQSFADNPARVVLEREAASYFHHNFIISMDYAFQSESLVFMVVDLGTCGTLADAMDQCDNRMMPEERVLFYSAEIILALSHIHRLGMIYRDLKPGNVLLCEDGHIKLVDLGSVVDVGGKVFGSSEGADNVFERSNSGVDSELQSPSKIMSSRASSMAKRGDSAGVIFRGTSSTIMAGTASAVNVVSPLRDRKEQKKSDGSLHSPNTSNNSSGRNKSDSLVVAMLRANSVMGTRGYMAPEMAIISYSRRNKGYTHCVDYWSLGVMMFEMLTSSLPFHHGIVPSFVEYTVNSSSCATNASRSGGVPPLAAGMSRKLDVNVYAPEVTKHPAFMVAFAKLDAVKGVSMNSKATIARFLEVDENKRLGAGASGLRDIKRQDVFEGLDWARLTQKLISPPYLPEPFEISDVQPYESFEEMLESKGKSGWLYAPLSVSDQVFFENWDWISSTVLKAELGIAQRLEQCSTFQLKQLFTMFESSSHSTSISHRVSEKYAGSAYEANSSYSSSISINSEPKRLSLAQQSKDVISGILKKQASGGSLPNAVVPTIDEADRSVITPENDVA